MARQQRSLRPIVELARELSITSWLAVLAVVALVLIEAGGLVLAVFQLAFWALLVAGAALVLRRVLIAWLLGRMRQELASVLVNQLLQQRYAAFLQDDPAAQASRLSTSLDRLQGDLLAPALQALVALIRLVVIGALLV
ncbi:MAG: hypothetical protein ACO231_09100, partial [Prochlorococcaceae cyanobacterium]